MDDRRTGQDRRRGRPPLVPGERSVPLSTALSASMFDALDDLSRRTGENMPSLVRRALHKLLRDERGTSCIRLQ